MSARFSILQLGKILFSPDRVFSAVAAESPPASRVFFRFAVWLGLLPPLFACAEVIESIANGRSGMMPAFGARLDATQIRLLAAWLKAGAPRP